MPRESLNGYIQPPPVGCDREEEDQPGESLSGDRQRPSGPRWDYATAGRKETNREKVSTAISCV